MPSRMYVSKQQQMIRQIIELSAIDIRYCLSAVSARSLARFLAARRSATVGWAGE